MSQQENTKKEQVFSNRLRGLRLRRGLNQEELANKLEVSKGSIGNWEGRTPNLPQLPTLRKIADFFGVSIGYLIGEEEEALQLHEETPEYKVDTKAMPTAETCLDYLQKFLSTCTDSGKIAWAFYELQEHFPLNKWALTKPTLKDVSPTVRRIAEINLEMVADRIRRSKPSSSDKAASPNENKDQPSADTGAHQKKRSEDPKTHPSEPEHKPGH